MGRNNKRNKAITKMYLKPLQKYCQQLEEQIEALKTDPNTTLGQVIMQARDLYTQNSRLSVLTAALLEAQGNRVTVKKTAMDKFENHRVVVKWELPEGFTGKPEEAEEFVFMYEAIKNEQPINVGPVAHDGQAVSPVITEQGIQGVDADNQELVIVEGVADASVADPESDGSNENEAIVSDRMQGVDCPYCEDSTEHKHSEEDVAQLRTALDPVETSE